MTRKGLDAPHSRPPSERACCGGMRVVVGLSRWINCAKQTQSTHSSHFLGGAVEELDVVPGHDAVVVAVEQRPPEVGADGCVVWSGGQGEINVVGSN